MGLKYINPPNAEGGYLVDKERKKQIPPNPLYGLVPFGRLPSMLLRAAGPFVPQGKQAE
ncbi:MAG: hypothetical protein ACHQ1H_04915 [Nitrososphaerales archaeon]